MFQLEDLERWESFKKCNVYVKNETATDMKSFGFLEGLGFNLLTSGHSKTMQPLGLIAHHIQYRLLEESSDQAMMLDRKSSVQTGQCVSHCARPPPYSSANARLRSQEACIDIRSRSQINIIDKVALAMISAWLFCVGVGDVFWIWYVLLMHLNMCRGYWDRMKLLSSMVFARSPPGTKNHSRLGTKSRSQSWAS